MPFWYGVREHVRIAFDRNSELALFQADRTRRMTSVKLESPALSALFCRARQLIEIGCAIRIHHHSSCTRGSKANEASAVKAACSSAIAARRANASPARGRNFMGGFTHNEPLPRASFLNGQAGPEWPATTLCLIFMSVFNKISLWTSVDN